MLITESARRFGYSPLRLLDQMEYLSEAEAAYDPAMVPVVESSEVGRYLVKVEDMVKFCESNGISDLGQGLYLVCESSGIDPSYVAFSVNQESLWESDMAELVADIMNEGVAVVGIPISPMDPACWVADAAVNEMLEYGSSVILESVCYHGDISIFAESYEAMNLVMLAEEDAKEKTGNKDTSTNNAEDANKKADGIWEKIKKAGKKPIKWWRSLMQRLVNWAEELRINATSNGEVKGIWNTIKDKIGAAIRWIAEHLRTLGSDEKATDYDYKTALDREAGRHQDRINTLSKKYKFGGGREPINFGSQQ